MVLSSEAEKRETPVLEAGARVDGKFCFGGIAFEMPMRHPGGVQICGDIK